MLKDIPLCLYYAITFLFVLQDFQGYPVTVRNDQKQRSFASEFGLLTERLPFTKIAFNNLQIVLHIDLHQRCFTKFPNYLRRYSRSLNMKLTVTITHTTILKKKNMHHAVTQWRILVNFAGHVGTEHYSFNFYTFIHCLFHNCTILIYKTHINLYIFTIIST